MLLTDTLGAMMGWDALGLTPRSQGAELGANLRMTAAGGNDSFLTLVRSSARGELPLLAGGREVARARVWPLAQHPGVGAAHVATARGIG